MEVEERDAHSAERGRCEGLHPWMERELWPPYRAPPVHTTAAEGGTPGHRNLNPRAAIRRGRLVDTQMSEWCAAVRARKPYAPPRGRRVHPYTSKIMSAMRSVWKWVPVRAQVGLRDRVWRIGTRADLVVACRRTGRLMLVEVKTAGAFNGAWAHDNSQRFYPPFEDVVSCPMNHALAQLTLTLALARRDTRHGLSLRGAYVVLVDDSHVQRYPLPPWCTTLYNYVIRRLNSGWRRSLNSVFNTRMQSTQSRPVAPGA